MIDVDDLARWLVVAGSVGLTGAVNAVGEVHTMRDFLSAASAVAGFDGEFVHVDDDVELLAADVRYWAGPRSLPLWLPVEDAGFATRDGAAFLRTGGTLRPLVRTLEAVLADEMERGIDRARPGLTAMMRPTLRRVGFGAS